VTAVGTMRTLWKQRRRARWVVDTFVGLALLCFLTFDVLDVDGSNLACRTWGEALTLEAVGSDMDRVLVFVPHALTPSDVQRNVVASVSRLAPRPSHASPVLSRLRLRFGTPLPRGRTEQTHLRASSTGPAEPA
jgi:hypothetical protein